MPSTSVTLFWVLLALTAASIEPILIKMGYRVQADPFQLLALKNIVSCIVMLALSTDQWKRVPYTFFAVKEDIAKGPVAKSLADPKAVEPGSDSGFFLPLALAAFLLCGTNILMLLSLQSITAVEFITVTSTTPLAVALLNLLFKNDARGKTFWLGLFASIVGVILSIRPEGLVVNVLGLSLALGAVVSSTTYRISVERILKHVDARLVSLCMFLINGAMALIILPFTGAINLAVLPYCLWMGMAAALANLAFISAIKALGATRMSIINLIQRPLVVVGAAVILNETCTVSQWIGVALVLIGVQWAQVRPVKIAQPEPVESVQAKS